MLIHVGGAPDFAMTRNLVSIFHKAKIIVRENDRIMSERVFTDRSLAMICREIRIICEFHALDLSPNNVQFKTVENLSGYQLTVEVGGKIIESTLILPNQVDPFELLKITNFFKDYFKTSS